MTIWNIPVDLFIFFCLVVLFHYTYIHPGTQKPAIGVHDGDISKSPKYELDTSALAVATAMETGKPVYRERQQR